MGVWLPMAKRSIFASALGSLVHQFALRDKKCERLQLSGDDLPRLRIGDLLALDVDLARGSAHHDFRLVQHLRIEKDHALTQMVLRAGASEDAGRRRLDRHGLARK